jgi:hypothetical protein
MLIAIHALLLSDRESRQPDSRWKVGVSVRVLHMGSPFKLRLKLLDRLMTRIAIPCNVVDCSMPICRVRGRHVGYPFLLVRKEDERLCTFREETRIRLKILI